MVIIGIDPGLRRTGYGVVRVAPKPELIEAGIVKTDEKLPLEQRLCQIHDGLSQVIKEFGPHSVAIEDLYSVYKHPRTAIMMGHARGMAFLAAAQRDVPVASYSATRIKKALTGNGQAGKLQMQRTIQSVFRLKELPKPADVADALAIALCHAYTQMRKRK